MSTIYYERTEKRLMPVHVVGRPVIECNQVQIMRRERLAWVPRGKLLTVAEAFEVRRLRRNEAARQRRARK